MQEPKQIRSTSQLNKVVEILLKLAIADCKVKGVTPLIVETVRTQERQYWLFGQGRTAEQLMKYHIPVKYAHKGNIVTQVTSSIHQLRCAVDVVPMRDNKAIWNANDKDTKILVYTMTQFGFEAGANWKNFKDSPHFQMKLPYPEYNSISQSNTTPYLTKAIQTRLGIKADGIWGRGTNEAVTFWRKDHGLSAVPVLYADNFKILFK